MVGLTIDKHVLLSLRVMPDTQRKDDAAALIDDEDYKDLFNFEENNVCSTCAE